MKYMVHKKGRRNTHPHVFVETRALTEALVTHATLVRPVLLVHVENVNAQAVSLLKRSANRK